MASSNTHSRKAARVHPSNSLEATQGRTAAAGGEAHEGLQLWAAKLRQHLQVSPWVSALPEDQRCRGAGLETALPGGQLRLGGRSWPGCRCAACTSALPAWMHCPAAGHTSAHLVKQANRHVTAAAAAATAIAVGGRQHDRIQIVNVISLSGEQVM